MDFGTVLEEIRPWYNTLTITGIGGAAVRMWFQNRKMKIAEKAADRSGWGELISALQHDVATLREENKKCEERYQKLSSDFRGVQRQLLALSVRGVLPPGTPLSDEMSHAVDSTLAHLLKDVE